MIYIKKDFWVPCDDIILEDSADHAVRCEKNALVVAGPGAGKTELLAQKAGFLFATNLCREPQKILAISFKKDAAVNLKERVIKRYGREIENRFVSMTYDAFFKSILDHFIYALPIDSRPKDNYGIADDAAIDFAFTKAGFVAPFTHKKNDIKTIQNRMIAKLELPVSGNSLEAKAWTYLLKGSNEQLPALSFTMIAMLAKYIIDNNPMIRRALQYTYAYVFLDEFQDTTDLQYSIVKSCFQGSKSVVTAVGDNKQRIMLWAGALKTVFEDFQKDFDSEKFQLIMNHRSAPRLVVLQKEMYNLLKEPKLIVKTSKKWNEEDGRIQLLMSKDEQYEAIKVSESIQQQIKNGININDICILCKQRIIDYSPRIVENLQNIGIRARDETEYQDLIKEPIIRLIIDFLLVAIKRKNPNEWRNLEVYYGKFTGMDNESNHEQYFRNIECLIKSLDKVKKMEENVETKNDFEYLIQYIIDFWGISRIKAQFPEYQQGNYLNEKICKFVDIFWKEYELGEKDWIRAIENFIGVHSIPIMTIHKSKGLEYSAVYFIGLEDSAFWNFLNQSEEDRCAFFVALSRAKEFLMFTFSEYRSNLKYPEQKRKNIDEFYELLQKSNVIEVI